MPNKLLLVDDHPVMIETLGTAIRKTYPNTEVFEADSISAARYAIRQRIAQPQSAFPRADVLGGICLRPPPKNDRELLLGGPQWLPFEVATSQGAGDRDPQGDCRRACSPKPAKGTRG